MPGFLELYFDSLVDASDLDGSGFNDGTLILNGTTVGTAISVFSVTDPTPVPLDGAGADDYPAQHTVSGFGAGTNVTFNSSLAQDPAFFITPLAAFGIEFVHVALGIPYVSGNPSSCYTGAAAGAGAVGTVVAGGGCAADHVADTDFAGQVAPAAPGIMPFIGSVNLDVTAGDPDFVLQTDFSSPLTLTAAIPEPGSLALLGLGLGALGLLRRFRSCAFRQESRNSRLCSVGRYWGAVQPQR